MKMEDIVRIPRSNIDLAMRKKRRKQGRRLPNVVPNLTTSPVTASSSTSGSDGL